MGLEICLEYVSSVLEFDGRNPYKYQCRPVYSHGFEQLEGKQASPKTSMTAKPASAATYSTLESSWDSKTCQKGSQMLYFDCNLLLKSSSPYFISMLFFVLAVVNISANIPHCEIFITVLPILLQKLQIHTTKISLDQVIFSLIHKMANLFTS